MKAFLINMTLGRSAFFAKYHTWSQQQVIVLFGILHQRVNGANFDGLGEALNLGANEKKRISLNPFSTNDANRVEKILGAV